MSDDDRWTTLDRWEADEADPNFLTATPPDATPEEKLLLLFPAVPPPHGRPERVEWDRLGMSTDNDREVER